MEDIKQRNIQIMIKMIIDKLYNNTLKDYYTKRSKKQDDKIEKQDKEISVIEREMEKQLITIRLNKQEIENLRKEMGEQSKEEKKKNEEQIGILTLRNEMAEEQINGLTEMLGAKTNDATVQELINLKIKIDKALPGLAE